MEMPYKNKYDGDLGRTHKQEGGWAAISWRAQILSFGGVYYYYL
jgi:hypothetical protein